MRTVENERLPGSGREEVADVDVYEALVHFGAPLSDFKARSRMSLERAVPRAVRLARKDAVVLRVLPLLLARHRQCLDWPALYREARLLREERATGMLLELTGDLLSDRSFSERASDLRACGPDGEVFFFEVKGRFHRELARRQTPRAAKKWGVVLNMPEQSFRTVLDKHLGQVLECRTHGVPPLG